VSLIEEMARWDKEGRKHPEMILCPHEIVAVHMAGGYALATGRAQAVFVHVDVGTANACITPPAIVKKLESELMRIVRLPDVIARFKPLGIDPVGNSSEEFAKVLASDITRWSEVAKAGNIKMEQ
jgi:tripartite-type tricarboxylate transporter receptor subunit TctC